MKKNKIAVLALAATLAVVPTFSFAARSSSYDDRDDTTTSTTVSQGSSSSAQQGTGTSGTTTPSTKTDMVVASNGSVISTTGATNDKSGTTVGFVVGEAGNATATSNGGVKVGNVELSFATGSAETAGLPTEVVSKIDSLNQGKSLAEVLGNSTGVDLSGYTTVGNTRAVIATDATTGLTNTATEVVMYVNTVDSADMAVVYYDNNTGAWVYLPVVVDPVTKTVKFTVPGSCTVQLVKKA